MYEVYKSPAIVLRNIPSRESDIYSKIYTKEFGLIGATIPAARKESSKHRYALQEHSIAEISFIKSRRGYRVIGSLPGTQLTLHKEVSVKRSIVRVIKILEILVQGEQQDHALFDLIEQSLLLLSDETLDKRVRDLTELFVLASITHGLGYISPNKFEELPDGFFERAKPKREDILYIQDHKILFAEMINGAVFESQL